MTSDGKRQKRSCRSWQHLKLFSRNFCSFQFVCDLKSQFQNLVEWIWGEYFCCYVTCYFGGTVVMSEASGSDSYFGKLDLCIFGMKIKKITCACLVRPPRTKKIPSFFSPIWNLWKIIYTRGILKKTLNVDWFAVAVSLRKPSV